MPRKLKGGPSPSTLRKEAARAAVAAALAHERQVKSTRRIQARELRESCAARRVQLRENRKARVAELRAEKKAAVAELRAVVREQWAKQFARLAEQARRARAELRASCTPDRAAARAELRELRAAVERARAERSAALAAARKPARGGVRAMSVGERRAHQLAEAQQEFHEPWERALLAQLWNRRKLKVTPRRSLAESFNEWISENPGDVFEFADRWYGNTAADYDRQQLAAYELRQANRAPFDSSADPGYWGE